MSVLVRGDRPRMRRGSARPSVREVCLLAVAPAQEAWAQGDRVTWSGRVYRVEEAQARPEGSGTESGPDPGAARRYVHLSEAGAG